MACSMISCCFPPDRNSKPDSGRQGCLKVEGGNEIGVALEAEDLGVSSSGLETERRVKWGFDIWVVAIKI